MGKFAHMPADVTAPARRGPAVRSAGYCLARQQVLQRTAVGVVDYLEDRENREGRPCLALAGLRDCGESFRLISLT